MRVDVWIFNKQTDTLLCACNGGQKLTRLGPACVSGMLALARLVSVCRTPHSFTLCRSLRSSHRSSSDGLHCGGVRGHRQSTVKCLQLKQTIQKKKEKWTSVPSQFHTLWRHAETHLSADGPSCGRLGVQVCLHQASVEWLKWENNYDVNRSEHLLLTLSYGNKSLIVKSESLWTLFS